MRIGAVRAVRLVAGRELATRLRSRAFVVSTLIMLVFIGGYILLMNFVGSSTHHSTVGFTSATASLAAPVKATGKSSGADITTKTVSEAAGREQVLDGKLDALVVGSPADFSVVVKKNLKSDLSITFTTVARQQALNAQIRSMGRDPAVVNKAAASASVHVEALRSAGQYQTQRLILGIVAVVLLYMSLMINGQAVAQGVVEEKSSRVVELLLATVRPWQLMAGKVLGIAVVGLVQMVVFAVVGLGLGLSTGVLSIPAGLLTGTAVWTLVWYVIGFFMYAVMLAAAGALVSRQEDANSVVTPVLMLIIVPAVIGWSVIPANPDSQLGHVLSLVPLFSPMLMPMRIALGVAPAWEIALSVGLSVLLVVALVALAGRVYRNAVLRTGARVKLSEALRAA
ncbi:MAG TPA: ABC transporter permease [Actinocatenispora sp.]